MTSTDPAKRPARRIFVGDVQGCREELEQLLEEVRFDPARDELRPVGDLVNRGPDNPGCLRLLRSLGARPVLGNHDLHLLGIAAGERDLRPGDTLEDVLEAEDRDLLLDWLAAQPLLRVDGDLYQVHAGLHPHWSDPAAVLAPPDGSRPAPAAVAFATRARECDSEGKLRDTRDLSSPRRHAPWFSFYRASAHGGRTVVFGHWAVRGLVREPHLRGLDTGCVWGGALTAWIAEEDRLVTVQARRMHQRPG